jgi:hypothetical protein
MTDLSKATPRPWRVIVDDTGGPFTGWPSITSTPEVDTTVVHRAGFKQEYWGEASERETHANAALIVRAVNERDELIAALRDILEWYRKQMDFDIDGPAARARVLLAKVDAS